MGKFKFFDKNDCFIEYKWAFGGDFLQELFKEKYQCKYSMGGDGYYYLVIVDDKIYDIDIKECKKLLENDGKKAYRDETKDRVVAEISNKLSKNNIKYTINSGKFITFEYNNYFFKIEIVKKAVMPQ